MVTADGVGRDVAGVGGGADQDAVGVEDLGGGGVEQDVQGLPGALAADVDLGVADVDAAATVAALVACQVGRAIRRAVLPDPWGRAVVHALQPAHAGGSFGLLSCSCQRGARICAAPDQRDASRHRGMVHRSPVPLTQGPRTAPHLDAPAAASARQNSWWRPATLRTPPLAGVRRPLMMAVVASVAPRSAQSASPNTVPAGGSPRSALRTALLVGARGWRCWRTRDVARLELPGPPTTEPLC